MDTAAMGFLFTGPSEMDRISKNTRTLFNSSR